jgi:3-hydroxybutyrate dehydrogenase
MKRRVLITGGGSGIGRAMAQAFADRGDAVTIAGRRMAPLHETARGRDMTCRSADVTDELQVAALFDAPFDVVIANAGGAGAAKLAKLSLAEWNATLAVNLTGTFLIFRAALARMPEGGRLIAIASTAALKGNASVPAYAAAKHGVLGLVRSVALDLAPRGITCNAICPGFADTELAEAAISGVMARFGLSREAARQRLVAGNPQQRLIAPEEIAAAALYLAAPEAASINGQALALSGGET